MEQVFRRIYERNTWGLGSGPGSLPGGLEAYVGFLQGVLRTSRPSRVVDLGCGYFSPYANIDWGDCHYIGIDVVAKCIRQNLRYSTPKRAFLRRDWCHMPKLPDADLALCKDVLQHWNHQYVCRGLARLSKYPLVLITNSIMCGRRVVNAEIGTGGFRPLNVAEPPYCLRAKKSQVYRVKTNAELDKKLIFLWEPRTNPAPFEAVPLIES